MHLAKLIDVRDLDGNFVDGKNYVPLHVSVQTCPKTNFTKTFVLGLAGHWKEADLLLLKCQRLFSRQYFHGLVK